MWCEALTRSAAAAGSATGIESPRLGGHAPEALDTFCCGPWPLRRKDGHRRRPPPPLTFNLVDPPERDPIQDIRERLRSGAGRVNLPYLG